MALRGSRLRVGATAVALASIVGLARMARRQPYHPLDYAVTRRMQQVRGPWLDRLMVAVSRPGYAPWNRVILAASTALVTWQWGWLTGAFVPLSSGASGIGNYTIKRVFGRARPGVDLVQVFVVHEDYSFPSGHVMTYTSLFGFLLYLCRSARGPGWRRGVLLVTGTGLILLIGPSRIYVGAHWFSDVLAAYIAGGLVLWCVVEGHRALQASPRGAASEARRR